MVVFAIMAVMTLAFAAARDIRPDQNITPTAAVAALKASQAKRVFNDYDYGGYLIYSGVAPFIDGRTELYGGEFMKRQWRAIMLRDLDDFLRLLDEYRIDATLFAPSVPAVALLDHLPGWRRIHADDVAVVHVRDARPTRGAEPSVAVEGTTRPKTQPLTAACAIGFVGAWQSYRRSTGIRSRVCRRSDSHRTQT